MRISDKMLTARKRCTHRKRHNTISLPDRTSGIVYFIFQYKEVQFIQNMNDISLNFSASIQNTWLYVKNKNEKKNKQNT